MQGTQVALESNTFFLIIEYIAILCCGMVGGLSAIRKGYDLFAILITAWLTALGGGIVRDVMLGAVPPVGIADKGFVFTALASGMQSRSACSPSTAPRKPCCTAPRA